MHSADHLLGLIVAAVGCILICVFHNFMLIYTASCTDFSVSGDSSWRSFMFERAYTQLVGSTYHHRI